MISKDTTLILSQDYELFFHRSGTIEKCLFEPCDALMRSAREHGYKITFYVDAGMLCRMQACAGSIRELATDFDRIRRHLAELVAANHDIGLHIHPHWEDTRFVDGRWAFENTRYRLSEFSDVEAAEIVARYVRILGEACGVAPTSYRAGGFCIEPFSKVAVALLDAGIDVDSSVVPGAYLKDSDKGFDFRGLGGPDWWYFEESPSIPKRQGRFLEIPVTPMSMPFWYYWRRLFSKLGRHKEAVVFGDGSAKRIGKREVLRRLAGLSRVAELSIDDPKANELQRVTATKSARRICHIMGHPKNLSIKSLLLLENLLTRQRAHYASVAGVARRVRGGEFA
ncbi:MAG: hypothetical protein ACREQ8_08315 [Woeseiaceae bacterium]